MENRRGGKRNNKYARARKADSIHRKKARENRIRRLKLSVMVFLFFSCFLYLAYVIIEMKLVSGDEFEAKALTQLVNGSLQGERTIVPLRGSIVDRNMQGLAVSARVYTVYIDPRMLVNDDSTVTQTTKNPETGEEEAVQVNNPETGLAEPLTLPVKEDSLNKLQKALALSTERMQEIEAMLEVVGTEKDEDGEITRYIPAKDNNYEIIAKEVAADQAAALEELGAAHIYMEADSKRNYLNGGAAASVIGFVRGDTLMGLEKQYAADLAGTPGRTFQVYTSDGFVETEKIEPQDGATVITTIDLAIQRFAEDAALKYGELYDAAHTSVIVMDPKSAEIFAMAAYPTFDPNDIMNLASVTKSKYRDEWQSLDDSALLEKMNTVWRNFNIYDAFEPGSIFKPVTVAAALEEGVITPESTFVCTGSKNVLGVEIHCNKLSGHGTITLREAIAESCNCAMMDIAERLGSRIFHKYQEDFGFGEKTGVDLPYEREDTNYLLHSLDTLGPIELATASFGQRFNATAMQDITAFASLINGGNLMRPYVVSQVVDSSGAVVKENVPTVVRKVVAPSTSDFLRQAMESTVADGTGWRAKIDGWAIGGKTGTAEQGISGTPDFHYALDFMAYFPVENPAYLVMVTVDHPNMATYVEGETSPGPMMKEVIQNIIKYQSIPPTYDSGEMEYLYQNAELAVVGDYFDKPLQTAISELNRLGLGFELVGGNGTVVSSQFPEAGTKVEKGKAVLLTVANGSDEELVAVPDLVGLTRIQAEEMLTALNLVPWAEEQAEENPVSSDDPAIPAADPGAVVPPEPEKAPDETGANTSGADDIVTVQMPATDKMIAPGTEVKIILKPAAKSEPEA